MNLRTARPGQIIGYRRNGAPIRLIAGAAPDHVPTLSELRTEFADNPTGLRAAVRAAKALHDERMTALHREAGDDALTASAQRAFDVHDREHRAMREFISEDMLAQLRAGGYRGESAVDPGPHARPDPNPGPPSTARSQALRHADDANKQGWLPDHARDKIQRLVDEGSELKRTAAADWAAVAGDPAYRSAFAKLAANPTQGHLEWTEAEAEAYRKVARWKSQSEQRTALALAGYVLPTTLDPAIMITNDGSINPLRQLARTVTTVTSTWRGITSAGATAEWKVEGAEAADGTPAAAEVEIPVFLADVDAIYSYEVGQDGADFLNQLMIVIRDAMENLQATAFTTGNGSTAPQGIVTGLVGGASEINGGGTEVLDADDPVTLQNALPARFSMNASWLSHIATRNTFAFMETTNGALLYPELRQSPPSLLTKPWHELSNMDGAINAAATANNYLMVYGDVRQGFVIVDHVGSTVEFLPGYGTNNRPSAQRHAFVTSRHGSEVVVPQAMRLLDVPTTA